MRVPHRVCMLLLCGLGLLAACSDQPPEPPGGVPPAELSAPSVGGLYIGQEVWITWQVAQPGQEGQILRSRVQAQAVASSLRALVLAGEDIGRLARLQSNAPGGVADGYVVLPVHPERPDGRDEALMRVREGELTELVEWRGGWWFAKRVSAEKGVELRGILEEAQASEVRGQAILFHYVGAHPFLHDQKRTREEQSERAQTALTQALGGADFAALARTLSSDLTGDAGGLLTTIDAATRKPTPWIRLGNPDFGVAVLNALFRGEVGRVVPEVFDTSRGFVLVKPLERRKIAR